MKNKLATVLLAAALFTAYSCKEGAPPAPPPRPAEAVKAQALPAPVEPKIEDSSVPSESGKSDPDCVGPIQEDKKPKALTIGGKKVELSGYRLTFLDKAGEETVIGVVANTKDDIGENLFNLNKYIEWFKAEKVELIVVAGDSGETAATIGRVLEPLAKTKLPVLVIQGNREPKTDFVKALANLGKKYPNVVNFAKVRHVSYNNVDLVSLPGYHDSRYIHHENGCLYFKEDIEALKPVVAKAANPVVMVAHTPPHGEAPTAIDVAELGGYIGDSNITAFLRESKVPFGIFSNVHEAGGKATDLSGKIVIAQDTFADTLYLNPALADSLPWQLNDKTQSYGMVAVLVVKGKQAKYKIYRAAPLTEQEKAEAAKLAPKK